MARLNNGSSSVYDFGPGGYARIPFRDRFIKIFNNTGADMFIPDNSAAEKQSVYYNFNVPNATKLFGQYVIGNTLYNNRSAIGPGPCWFGTPQGGFNTPGGCPSGFSQTMILDNAFCNANLYRNDPNHYHRDVDTYGQSQLVPWAAFQEWDYGCTVGPPTWAWHTARTRFCAA